MRLYLYITFIFFVYFSAPAQNSFAQNTTAQLLKELNNAKHDSEKVIVYNKIFLHFQYSNPDSANFYLKQGLDYFTAHKDPVSVAYLTCFLGFEDGIQGRMELARKRHTSALRIFEQQHNEPGIATAHSGLGIIDGRTGHFDSATMHFMIALKIFEQAADTDAIERTYLKLGAACEGNNLLDRALDFYNKAIHLSNHPDSNILLTLYDNIGIVYAKKGDFHTGIDYFKYTLAHSNNAETVGIKISALTDLGIAYTNLGKDDSALFFIEEALQITREKNLPAENARIMLNLTGIISKANPAQAIDTLKQALKIAQSIDNQALITDIYSDLSDNYVLLKDYKNAFQCLQLQKNLEDSLSSIEKAKELVNLQSVYELEQSNAKVKNLETLATENMHERNLIIIIAVILGMAFITVTLFYRRTKLLNDQLHKREIELQQSNDVKDKLFSIIGHDLRGPIANIPAMIQLIKDPTTSEEDRNYMYNILTAHSEISLETLDKLLYWGKAQIKGIGTNSMPFNAGEHLQNCIKLLRSSAQQKQISLINHAPENIIIYCDPAHFDFVVRNLISNSIKFTNAGGAIEITTDNKKIAGMIIFAVKDNGTGMAKDKLDTIFGAFGSSTRGTAQEKGTGIGLMLCKEFVQENGGNIWAESEPGKGSIFYFSFRNTLS